MQTRKLGLMAGFALSIFTLGILLDNAWLILAAVPIVLYMALALAFSRPHLDVTISRRLPERQVYEGEEVTVALKVANKGPHVDLEMIDGVPPGIDLARGSNHVFVELDEGETRELGYSFFARLFGTYTFGPVRVRALDGASVRSEEKTFGSYGYLRIYPEIKYLNRVELRHPRPRNWPGEVPTRKAGSGLEFYGIREHMPGDSLRRVNWKASGRTGRLMLNQYMNEAGGETVVVLDSRPASTVGAFPETTATYSVRAAAAVSYRLIRDRNRVGLLGVGRNVVKVLPGSGGRQFDRLLTALISVEMGDEDWTLGLVPDYISLFFSRMAQVVLVSPLVDTKPFTLVSDLAQRGYEVLVISPSPVDMELPGPGDRRLLKVAAELARLDRNRRLSSLRRHARVVDWDPRSPLGEALEELKEPWQVRRPG